MGLPPSVVGAVQVTVAAESPAVAVTPVGTPWGGMGCGLTGAEGAEDAPGPLALEATTVKVYVTPFVSPLTSQKVVLEVLQVFPAGVLVTR